MEKFRKGQWYVVIFWDHVMGMDEPVKCKVAAQCIKQDKLSVTLTWWETLHKDYKEDNHELVTLLKSTLVSVTPLKSLEGS
jgi:hypothetical protein